MVTATLEGVTVTACAVHLPAYGIPWADVELDEPTALSGSVTLALPGLSLVGTIMSGGPWQGRARYRVAGGAGGWGKTIAAKSYTNDAGVKLWTVLRDAAEACGETINADTVSGTVGSHYTREAGPASRALALLADRAWYVDEAGVTRLGARAATTYDGDATRMGKASEQLRLELAADDLAGLLPGATVSDGQGVSFEAVDVVHRLGDGKLRTTVWGELGGSSRVGSALHRLIAQLTAAERYRGVWSYRIVSQSGERLDLQAVRVSTGMPDQRAVRVRPGVPGVKADHAIGSRVLVAFVDGDPGQPVVVGFEDADSEGFEPGELFVDADDLSVDVGLLGSVTLAAGNAYLFPWESATSCEAVCNLLTQVVAQLGHAIPGPMNGAALAAAWPGILNAAIAACPAGTIAPYKAAILAALLAKAPDPTMNLPGLGWPGVNGS